MCENFIQKCLVSHDEWRLTPQSEPSPFALCFAVFTLRLLRHDDILLNNRSEITTRLFTNLHAYCSLRKSQTEIQYDKPFLQLLSFTLSALSIVGGLECLRGNLEKMISPLLVENVSQELQKIGVADGLPQSGNMAMFMAILLIYAHNHL